MSLPLPAHLPPVLAWATSSSSVTSKSASSSSFFFFFVLFFFFALAGIGKNLGLADAEVILQLSLGLVMEGSKVSLAPSKSYP